MNAARAVLVRKPRYSGATSIILTPPSFRRMPESRLFNQVPWIPACAGMTEVAVLE
jgi:hypothetical protein